MLASIIALFGPPAQNNCDVDSDCDYSDVSDSSYLGDGNLSDGESDIDTADQTDGKRCQSNFAPPKEVHQC